ncbi:CC0125/CC1285 family lipoprotein [Maricaulis sp.]|uniref:CC0125/CC1285 family lipoprotein n=1 Tax=Maricaulis sp. TaxID=1486257 RepID=UPI003A8C8EBF
MKRVLIIMASLTALGACATATPYQAADGSRPGFTETRIETNRYRISFDGNSMTDRETVETYLLYRAAELTVENGYDYFTVVTRATDEETRVMPSALGRSPYAGFSVQHTYFHPRWGWHGWRDPFWDDVSYRESTRYEASAEIHLGRGTKPDDPSAFGARDVMSNLGDQIVRPSSD